MDDDPAYLQPGFNPTDLKVAELRGVLLEHDVQYPSTAKKAQLVALFEQHIAPHASQILAQRNSVRASSKGIVSANDQRSTVSAPRRSSRRAKSRGSVSADDGSPVADLLDSIVVGNNDQEEVEPPKTVRRSRRRSSRGEGQSATPTPTPQKKRATETQTDTPFSMDNVFQKRSPARSTPSVAKDNRGKSPSGRRLTDFLPTPDPTTTAPPANGSRRRLEVPVSRLQPAAPIQTIPEPEQTVVKIERVDRDDDLIPAGEEFTPEEAEELEKEEQEARLVRSQNRTVESTSHSTSMIWAVVGALLCAYFVWWRKEKLEIGYCGVGKTAPHGFKLTEPSWAELLQPDCEPCPINAICKPNFKAECKPDYVLVNSAASLGGLIPIPPTCEPDTEKLRRIAILSEEAIKIIRRRAADVECGEIVPIKPKFTLREEDKTPSGTKIKAREGGPIAQGKGIDESELRQMLYELKAPKLSDLQFDELFKAALEDAASQEEMEGALEDRDSATPSLILASSSLAAISLTCSVRLSLIRTLANYRFELISAIAALIAILQINHKVQQRRQNNALVTKYVHLVLRRLAKRAEQAYKNGKEDDAAVAVVQMRDQVMQHEFSHEKRKLVWEGVQKVVECNSNVRATSREIRGEVLRCWTWIGAVGGWEEVGSGANEENSEIEFPRVVA